MWVALERREGGAGTCTAVSGLVCLAAVQAAAHLQAEHELVALRLVLALEAAVLLHVATVVPAFGTKRAQASASSGAREAAFGARARLRLPRAPGSLGQSATWAALADTLALVSTERRA